MSQKSVSVSKLAKLLDLKIFTKELDIKKHKVTLSDVNRPALQLSGYFEYFEPNRVQIIGMVEYSFLKQMDPDKRIEIYNALLEREIPCIIFAVILNRMMIFYGCRKKKMCRCLEHTVQHLLSWRADPVPE